MIYRENEEYKLMPYLATFEQHGEEHEQYVINKDELETFEKMGHITNLQFEEVVYDGGLLKRLEKVKNYSESQFQEVIEYVIEEKFSEGTPDHMRIDLLEESIITLMMEGF